MRAATGSRRHLVVNKASVALAPEGCDKGTGLRAAVAELGVAGIEFDRFGGFVFFSDPAGNTVELQQDPELLPG